MSEHTLDDQQWELWQSVIVTIEKAIDERKEQWLGQFMHPIHGEVPIYVRASLPPEESDEETAQ